MPYWFTVAAWCVFYTLLIAGLAWLFDWLLKRWK